MLSNQRSHWFLTWIAAGVGNNGVSFEGWEIKAESWTKTIVDTHVSSEKVQPVEVLGMQTP